MPKELPLYDVTIIGGGPAGLYTAFYSGMRDLKTKLIECEPELGGRILLYPEKMIWDVGGIPHISGQQLITQLVEQAKTFDPTIVLNQQIAELEKLTDGTFLLTAATGEKHHSKTIILTVGFGHLVPQKLDIVGAEHYEETNLHYTVQELETFRGKNVLISGGGNSAVDWVNELEPIANNIMVVHRRDDFGGHERNVIKMRSSAVNIYTPYEIAELHSGHDSITQVSIAHLETDHIEKVSVDAVIVNHGLKYDYGPLANWGIDMRNNLAVVNAHGETNIPGIYGAGDFIDQPTKVQLIAGAFTDGAHAVNSAKLHINPQAPKVAYVSSHNIRFKERNKQIGLDDDNYQDVEG